MCLGTHCEEKYAVNTSNGMLVVIRHCCSSLHATITRDMVISYLWGCCFELLEEVREEAGILLQLGQYLNVVEQHHAL